MFYYISLLVGLLILFCITVLVIHYGKSDQGYDLLESFKMAFVLWAIVGSCLLAVLLISYGIEGV